MLNYFEGEGVKKDTQKAVELWSAAADHGLAQAQYNLGIVYESVYKSVKEGDREDLLKKSFNLYMKAAEQGFVEAQYNLGAMYFNGAGVEMNIQKAEEWWSKAAKKGHALSLYALTVLRSSDR